MWKSVSPLYRDRGGCILRSGARRRRHVTMQRNKHRKGPAGKPSMYRTGSYLPTAVLKHASTHNKQ